LSLIQIPKIEYITLDQFIPNWTEIIEEMDEMRIIDNECYSSQNKRSQYAGVRGLEFGNCKFCLVGEAHHNSNDYASDGDHDCKKCCRFCGSLAWDALVTGEKTFQNFKLDLFTHMLEAHSELMIR